MNNALKNAKVTRRYIEYLRDAKRRSESTIRSVEREIHAFESSTRSADFSGFDRQKAKKFTQWLEEIGPTGSGTSAHQSYHILRNLSSFFHWLAFQPSYKSRILASDIEYLSLDKIKIQEVNSQVPVDRPSKDHVTKLVASIRIENDIDKRDRALISFLLLSGMRDMAIVTLPLECFDTDVLEVKQFPELGVKTKNSKRFVSKLFIFDESLLQIVTSWVEYLKNERSFRNSDPMFPRNRIRLDKQTGEFISTDIEPVFWKSASPIRSILKQRSAQAGLSYYKPHSFRHAATQLALEKCVSPEEYRAVSQNLGHENVGTTLTSYAKLTPDRLQHVLGSIDFGNLEENPFDDEFMRKIALLARSRERA